MADAPKKSTRFLEFALIFVLAYLISQVVLDYVYPGKRKAQEPVTVTMTATQGSYRKGATPMLKIHNGTDKPMVLENRCPMPPVTIYRVEGAEGSEQLQELQTTEAAIPCQPPAQIAPHSDAEIDLAPWKYSLFGEHATYEAQLASPLAGSGSGTGSGAVMHEPILKARFGMHEPGAFVKLFRTFITKPFLNFLVFIASVTPGHNLGIAIIVLTLVVKLLLFYPTQHALEGQKKLQALQPKIDALRGQYGKDPQKLHEETVKLWKAANVNPFQTCVPMLIQFPILIGLFFVVRDGSHLPLSREYIYPFYQNLSWTFGTNFLGLDLMKPSIIFPPLLVILQFLQMYLSFHAKKKSQEPTDPSQVMQQRVMMYALPLMIGFFAYKFPGAVSIYWGISTLFAIGQQMIVNRRAEKHAM